MDKGKLEKKEWNPKHTAPFTDYLNEGYNQGLQDERDYWEAYLKTRELSEKELQKELLVQITNATSNRIIKIPTAQHICLSKILAKEISAKFLKPEVSNE